MIIEDTKYQLRAELTQQQHAIYDVTIINVPLSF